MAISEFEIKRIEKHVGQYIESKRPAPHLRDQVDLTFRIEGQSVVVYEIREAWNRPGEKIEEFIAKATYVKKSNSWKIYWQRADLKWHSYDPDPQVDTLEEFLSILEKDEFACFWG